MITFERENKIVKEALLKRLSSEEYADVDLYVAEFSGVQYRIQGSEQEPQALLLSILVPKLQGPMTSHGLPRGALEDVEAVYRPLGASRATNPEPGYDLTLRLDVSQPPSPESRDVWAGKLASLRSVVMGASLRSLLLRLYPSAKESSEVAPQPGDQVTEDFIPIARAPSEVFFARVAPGLTQVEVIHPMHFSSPHDALLAISFLKEMAAASPAGPAEEAAACRFYPPTEPLPPRIQAGVPVDVCANAGFVVFAVAAAQVGGGRLEALCWALCTFHAHVAYHVKCTKIFLDSRIRRAALRMRLAIVGDATPSRVLPKPQ